MIPFIDQDTLLAIPHVMEDSQTFNNNSSH